MGLKILQKGEIFCATGEKQDFICCKCNKEAQAGFACNVENRMRVFCEDCQNTWNNEKTTDHLCKIALIQNRTHQHIKFQRI